MMSNGDFLWQAMVVVAMVLSISTSLVGLFRKPRPSEPIPQPLRVQFEEKFTTKASFHKHCEINMAEHKRIDGEVNRLAREMAAQQERSEVNGARLVQLDAKMDRVLERLPARPRA
jgi:hypothetical protein